MTVVAFKNCTLFINCMTKIYGTTIDDAKGLDWIMTTYNLLEFKPNYSDTTNNLYFHSKDEATDFNVNIVNNKTINPMERMESLKYLRNF